MSSTYGKSGLLIFLIFFTIYVYTSDAHRYTFDEDIAAQQTLWLVTLTPDPSFVLGESKDYFNYPELFPQKLTQNYNLCKHELLCSPVYLGHSLTQIPFIWLNHTFKIFNDSNFWSVDDFDHPHYVYWRNNINPDFTFLELFYGPFFSALSVSFFFLISRTLNFNFKNSLVITFLFGLSTAIWPYSQTSLNLVPQMTFVLLGILFLFKFQKYGGKNLIFAGASLGFAFNIRPDTILVIIIASIVTFFVIKKSKSILNYLFYFLPISLFVVLFDYIEFIRHGRYLFLTVIERSFGKLSFLFSGAQQQVLESNVVRPAFIYSPLEAFFGLLFSPGVGLLVFSPILFLSIVAFTDFFKYHKKDFFLFLGIILSFLLYFSILQTNTWHGLVGWSARYLILTTPFFLLPLGYTLEKRKSKLLFYSILILGSIGVLSNISWLSQDVSWFVWGIMGGHDYGLYSLPSPGGWTLRISPLTLWTFEFSQLTNSIFLMFSNLQPDIFLLKIFNPVGYGVSLLVILGALFFSLYKLAKPNKKIITS